VEVDLGLLMTTPTHHTVTTLHGELIRGRVVYIQPKAERSYPP
jgi:hypothetical protein